MFPTEFDYYRADSVADAISLLGEHSDAELLAGGHGLLPLMKTREHTVSTLVDVSGLDDLDGVNVEDGVVTVGALSTHTLMADSDVLHRFAGTLADAAAAVGDLQVRNGGTFGGNVAHADPRSDPLAALLATGGEVVAQGPHGERTIDVDDFFVGAFDTALDDRELLTSVRVPAEADGTASAYVKRRNPLSGYALVGVAVSVRTDGETVSAARVAANGVLDRPVRLTAVEDALAGASLDTDSMATAATAAGDGFDPDDVQSDVQASGEYRLGVLPVYTERALTATLDRLDGD